jgi:putative FmdB family regulatory protein
MPNYNYECVNCGTLTLKHKITVTLEKCPRCGGHIKKKISVPTIIYRGSGWTRKGKK